MVKRVAPLMLVALLAACGEQSVELQVQLLTQSCPGADGVRVDALQSVSHLEFIITGDGIGEPINTIAAVGDGSAALAGIPLGEAGQIAERRIEVRAHFDAPDGPVTARGLAVVHLDAADLKPPPVPVFLRPVQSFVYTADSEAPESCTQMSRPRAGHTATTLNDGRVLITGGAEFDALGSRTVHDSAELYDPFTGKFEVKVRGAGGPNLPRVFHTATKLQDGRVVVVGGEFDTPGGDRDVLRPAEIFRPDVGEFDTSPIIAATGRTRHAASVYQDQILVSGGYADPDPATGHPEPLRATELFDGIGERFLAGPDLPEAKAEHCSVAIANGVVVVAGGKTRSGTDVVSSANLHFLRIANGAAGVLEQGGSPLVQTLTAARFGMACESIMKDADLIVVLAGGFTTVDVFGSTSAHPGIEVFNPSATPQVSDAGSMPAGARGNLCVVKVDDRTVVFAGGFNADDQPASKGSEWLSTSDGSFRVAQTTGRSINEGRFLHRCTRLLDGSVLVTGGMSPDAGGTPVSVATAELYTPIVRD